MNESFAKAFQAVTGLAYVVLMTNLLVGLPLAPLVLFYVTADLTVTWHAIVIAGPFVAPLLTAAFGVLTHYSEAGETAVIRTFIATLRATFTRALIVGVIVTAGLAIVVVDIAMVWPYRWGAMVVPILVMGAVLLLATALTALVAIAVEPEAKMRLAWKASLALAVRRWYLSAMSLVVLAVFLGFALSQPALALGLALTPALYLIWANARFSLRPVLPPSMPQPA